MFFLILLVFSFCTRGLLHGEFHKHKSHVLCYNDTSLVGPVFVSLKERRSLINCITNEY